MLHVDYKYILGEFEYKNGMKTTLCGANCLWGEMLFENDEATLMGFAVNIDHVKNMIASNLWEDLKIVRFQADKLKENKDLWKVARLFIDNGKEVTFLQK